MSIVSDAVKVEMDKDLEGRFNRILGTDSVPKEVAEFHRRLTYVNDRDGGNSQVQVKTLVPLVCVLYDAGILKPLAPKPAAKSTGGKQD